MPDSDVPSASSGLEQQIRQKARASAQHLPPVQAANLIHCAMDEQAETDDEWLRTREDLEERLHSRFPDYFDAAEAVRASEADADIPRFRAWRREQLRLAGESDGFAAVHAVRVRTIGGAVLAAAILTKPFGLISADTFFLAAVLGTGILLLGSQLLKRRRSPLWEGVFTHPKFASYSVWHCAAEAAAASLIREHEPCGAQWDDALRIAEGRWDRRNRRSPLWAEEDYSGIRCTAA
ncbi:hypothetical protein ITX31_13345 [Arthrobacter gandavensis]|uniref:hypothetical protein n=1 Tax=Arthrobacter gandavensis TaxID=169960 RepID=UPI00188FEABF|nr:hypothetical protein [Arthrobacter gandavensis]MBF4995088.1 hypothetical protein [Arthrobacter gandavensis]